MKNKLFLMSLFSLFLCLGQSSFSSSRNSSDLNKTNGSEVQKGLGVSSEDISDSKDIAIEDRKKAGDQNIKNEKFDSKSHDSEAELKVQFDEKKELPSIANLESAPSANSNLVEKKDVNLKAPEKEIPVILEGPKKTTSTESSMIKFIFGFFVVGVMGAGSYILLKKYRFKNTQTQRMQIKVLTQHYLGPKKSLAIIRVAGESMLIGVTDNNINLIKSLALLDEDMPQQDLESPIQFNSVFNQNIQEGHDHQDDSIRFDVSPSAESRDDNTPVDKKTFSFGFKKNAKNGASMNTGHTITETHEDFAFTGIQDMVSGKLKGMRNIK